MNPSRSVLIVLTTIALLWVTIGDAQVGQRGKADDSARLLAGAIDIHVHSDPDNRPRSIDAIDVWKPV